MQRAKSLNSHYGIHVKSDPNTQAQPAGTTVSLVDDLPEAECTDCKLRQLSRAVSRHFDDHLRAHDLRSSQYSLLSYIRDVGSSQLNHAAKALKVEASTISRTVFILAESGLLEVAQGKNRRTTAIMLTQAGERRLDAALSSWEGAHQKLQEKLGADSYQRLNSLLDESLKLFEDEQDH